MAAFESVIDAVGGTPLVRLRRVGAGLAPRIYVKLEFQNPGGSVKDRAALSMIRAAEADGSLRPGGTIVETTSGNTGIGLALVGAHLGYRTVIFTSGSIAQEKIRLLRAYGAEVRTVDAYVPKSHPDSLASQAARFVAQTPGAWRADQYDNPANPAAHVRSTAPEIWSDTAGSVTHLVATVGTGGTITGTGGELKRLSGGRVRVIGADPAASVYSGGDGSPKYVEGAGHALHPDAEEDVWPQSFDSAVVDEFIAVSDRDSIRTARDAARREGLLLGGSAGTALAAALRLAERLTADDVVVVLAPDSGRNALSTFYDDGWLTERGFVLDEADAVAPTVADLLDGPLVQVPRGLDVAAAVSRLAARGVASDRPVLVAHRDSDAPVAPGEVAGTTTLARLRAALAAGEGIDGSDGIDDVALHAQERPPTIGIGLAPSAALDRLDARSPGWTLAAVLSDGRVVGVVDRAALATLVAAEEQGAKEKSAEKRAAVENSAKENSAKEKSAKEKSAKEKSEVSA